MADHTQTFTVVVVSAQEGWSGHCLELPECAGNVRSRREAHKAVKADSRDQLRRRNVTGQPTPRRHAIVKYPRFDLRTLGVEVDDLR